MSHKKPVFVCIPGAWHGAWAYDLVSAELGSAGFRAKAVDLLSSVPPSDSTSAVDSFFPDVDVVYKAIAELLDAGEDVIAVCHSYGGIVMTEAVGRLVADRKSENKRGSGEAGRIRWLVYVAAYPTMEDMPLFGFAISVLGTLGIEPPTSIPYWDMQDGYCVLNEAAGDWFMSDLAVSEREKWVKKLGKQSFASFVSPASSIPAAWRSVPSSYIATTQDRCIEPVLQEGVVEQAARSAREKGGNIIPFSDPGVGRLSIDAGHDCMLSQPATLKALLVKIAERVIRSD